MRRFVLIDPCLCDLGSHPYQCCLDILAAAERAGFACEAVAHRSFRPAESQWPKRHRLDSILDAMGHSKYTAFGELDRLDRHGRPRMRVALPWAAAHAERRRAERIESFARGLEPVVRRVAAGDVVFLATASELDVAGLAKAIRAAGAARGVSWHAQFHYPLFRGFLEDFPRQERRLGRVRGLLAASLEEASPHRIHLHVTTDELASQHRRLGVAEVGVLPYPVRSIPGGRSGERLRIAALGDARPEKNSQHLAELAERSLADPLLAGRISFAIQSNFGFPESSRAPADRAVRRAIERLAGMPGGDVELLGGPLIADRYTAQLARADAMLLAYEQDRYRCRCSGVTLEAIVSGIVPIVTGGGWMSRMVAEPVRSHVDAVAAIARPAGNACAAGRTTVRHGNSWSRRGEAGPTATHLLATVRWQARGDDALNEPPAIVSLAFGSPASGGMPRRTVVMQADPLGRDVRALIPLPEGVRRDADLSYGVSIAPAEQAGRIDLDRAEFLAIEAPPETPISAAGLVVATGSDLVEGVLDSLRELERFDDHYRRSAEAHAAAVAGRFCGDRVVESLERYR